MAHPTAGDFRWAFRRLRATPLVSLAAILTLALGVGSAVVMVDLLDRLLLRAPRHVTAPERVARVYVGFPGNSYSDRTGYATFEALGVLDDVLEARAAFFSEMLSLGRGEHARSVNAVAHSPGYFTALGVEPFLGAWPRETMPAREDVAVISYGLWQRAFGSRSDILGQPLRLGVDSHTIVAVAPSGFAGIGFEAADLWLPLETRARRSYGNEWKSQSFFLQVIARLQPGVNRRVAGARVTATFRAATPNPVEQSNVLVLGDLRPARAPGAELATSVEVLVAGVSILVLLVTCGNVANLLLVRGLRRDAEFRIKSALGASRIRLLGEVLAEASLLAAGAGVAALIAVSTGGAMLRRVFLSPVAALASPLDERLVLITVGFSVATAFLLGLAPALLLTTRRALSPGHSATGRPSRMLDLFSGLQVALSLPLIIAASLFVLSLWHARGQDFGWETRHVAVLMTNLFEIGRPEENHAAHRRMEDAVARLPQVESTALVQQLPMRSASMFTIEVPGKDLFQGTVHSDVLPTFNAVDASFFRLMRMRLVQGRFFGAVENRRDGPSVAVVSESMARIIWPDEPAVGKCFYMGGKGKENPCTEVVGVVADARLFPSIRPTKQWASAYYVPIEQTPSSSSRALLVRTTGDPSIVLPTLRRISQAVGADLPYVEAFAFDEVFMSLLRPWRLGSTVFVVFGAITLVVAALGQTVVSAYGVTRRTREIGIRSALGAGPQTLVRLVLGRGLFVVTAGIGVGLAIAWAAGRVLSAHLFDVTAREPWVFAAAASILLLVGGFAAWVPARRAARIDPVAALRVE